FCTPAAAQQKLDKVSFGTNWVAEAEHGGYYQALVDGTYRRYGLDVTIVPGGPNVNNRILLPVGKLDFFMSANTLQSFDAVERNIPTLTVAAMFQKDPQVLIAHPDQGIDKFEDLKKLTLFISKEGLASYFQWLKADFGFSEARVKPYTSNPQPFLADKRSAMQSYVTSEPFALENAAGLRAYDPSGAPAALSRPIIQKLLRGRLRFQGVAITDALEAPTGHAPRTAGVLAAEAGADIVLFTDSAPGELAALEQALHSGK